MIFTLSIAMAFGELAMSNQSFTLASKWVKCGDGVEFQNPCCTQVDARAVTACLPAMHNAKRRHRPSWMN